MISKIYSIELGWIHNIQEVLRSLIVDKFFIGWSYVDTFGFTLVLIFFTWYLIDRKIGIKMLYILVLSAILNKFLKEFFQLPRPCQLDPSVGILCFKTPGFPSGAAQTAFLIAGITFLETKKKIYRFFGILFALFLSFSRIYLGVHFFTDILGGFGVGAVLLLLYGKGFPLFEKRWKGWSFLFPIAIVLIKPSISISFFWLMLGIACGLLLHDREKKRTQSWKTRILLAVMITFGVYLFYKGTKNFPQMTFIFAFIGGLWASFLGEKLLTYLPRKHF